MLTAISSSIEIQNFKLRAAQEGMIKSFLAMEEDPKYLKESEEIDTLLNTPLPEEKDRWWEK